MTASHPSERRAARIPRMLAAILVLAIRLAVGVIPMSPAGAASAAPAGAWAGEVICHAADPSDATPNQPPSQPPAHHDHDCGLCPICHFLAASALPSGDGPAVSPVDIGAVEPPAPLPPATGPPQAHRQAARPRGPPALSA